MEKHGGIKIMRGSILALALIVFLGNIMMWIVMPTDFYYQKWVPQIMAHTDSSYFGIQGPIMLDFTFPILFIAVLGCIYVHLGKKLGHENSECKNKRQILKPLRKPMIIKGLGIVNWVELFLLTMFLCLLVWYFSAFLHFWYEKAAFLAMSRREKLWKVKLERLGLALGLAGNLCLTFLFYPVARGSSILPLLGLTSEASIKYHTWLGNMAMSFFTVHGIIYVIYWLITSQASMLLSWNYLMETTYVSNIAGEIALLCGLTLWSTSYPAIRRKMFELFYYTHYLYIPFIIFFILHCGIFFPCIMLPGFYLFIVDRFLRFLQSRQTVQLLSARVLPCETVELNFAKNPGLSYSPTSTMFINVPSISKLQWHPFTVTSNCNLEPETISVVIKTEGTWTKNLYEKLSLPSSSSMDRIKVSVEGPYGPAQTDFLSHDTLIMICGGSGITPFISIIRELIYVSSKLRCKTPKIQLISVFKNSSSISMLDLLLPISGVPSEACNLDLQVEAYITREKGQSLEKQEPVRTISFKTKSSDAPVSSILGEYSWLWLALIISSSFVIFLLLIGIVTQYYIYPIDHNAYKKEMTTRRALINMLFICFSIAMTATAAFLMNKKKLANEAKQIQDMKVTDPVASFNSGLSHGETELESLPRQSLIKSTKVHYGGRPDLKRILLESKGESVGVLVSGPKNMKHDVAKICSSSLADNLYFQSISFSW